MNLRFRDHLNGLLMADLVESGKSRKVKPPHFPMAENAADIARL